MKDFCENDGLDNENEEQNELYEHYRIIVDKGQTQLRIDKYLTARIEGISRNKIQNAADANCVLVNENPVKSNYKVKGLDVISILLPHPVREFEILPEDIKIDIVFEDEHLLVVNKRPNFVVHPGFANYTGTLLNALLFHFQNTNQSKVFPLLVHRIDKDTSGLIVVAKTELAQTKLAKQFFDHTIERKYNALVWGDVKDDEGTIEGHIGRALQNRKMMTVFPDGEYGKNAITHYRVLQRYRYVTLVECQLETGRTHQIRAHMKFIGHPLFSDALYGGDKIIKGTTFTKYKQFVDNCFKILNRQALHAVSIGFVHPAASKKFLFESNLPEDFQMVIDKWNRYTNY